GSAEPCSSDSGEAESYHGSLRLPWEVTRNRRVTLEPIRGHIQAGLHVQPTEQGLGRGEGAVLEILVPRRTAPAEGEVAARGPAQVYPPRDARIQPPEPRRRQNILQPVRRDVAQVKP